MNTLRTLALLLAIAVCASHAAAPVVSNVRASQRAGTKLVDILYNVSDADGNSQTIGVEISGDGGLTYVIPATALSGHVGPGVTPGVDKAIVWNAGIDWNGQLVPAARVRITAHDGTTPPPPPGFVYIPAGSFQMGDSFYESGTNELPLHTVQVDGFFMERFEVSRELWISVFTWAQANGYAFSHSGAYTGSGHPVQSMNWFDAVKWCNARSEKEGRTPVYYTSPTQTNIYRIGTPSLDNSMVKWTASGYRLPTEAEWEKAARGGTLGARYPWGNTFSNSEGNFAGSGHNTTSPVGYYNGSQTPAGPDKANGYGLYDMAGNVWEWCWDWHQPDYYGTPESLVNPRGPNGSLSIRILRGGSWRSSPSEVRCAGSRYYNYFNISPGSNFDHVGLRCARGL